MEHAELLQLLKKAPSIHWWVLSSERSHLPPCSHQPYAAMNISSPPFSKALSPCLRMRSTKSQRWVGLHVGCMLFYWWEEVVVACPRTSFPLPFAVRTAGARYCLLIEGFFVKQKETLTLSSLQFRMWPGIVLQAIKLGVSSTRVIYFTHPGQQISPYTPSNLEWNNTYQLYFKI